MSFGITLVGLAGKTLNGGELVEDFVNVAMMENTEAAEIGHAVAEVAGQLNNLGEDG